MTGVDIRIIETRPLGDRSYVVTDGQVAVVIDPQRDIDRVLEVVGDIPVTHVLETHIHNDYVSGGRALAQQSGAAYVINAAEEVAFQRYGISDGEAISTGSLTLTALLTPGHTPTHFSYALSVASEDIAVFTGGSMLFGAVGRTDLVHPALTEELTRAQYHSARRLAEILADPTEVYPTHGFGSFCSATGTKGSASTIGKEKEQNGALSKAEDEFISELVSGLTAYPRYYAYMAPRNLAGATEPDLSLPAPIDAVQLRGRVAAGEWVVDLRHRKAFAARHVAGTISIELADPFATYLGWTIPWGTPLTIIGQDPEQIRDARRQLVRIGIDDIAGGAVGAPEELAPEQAITSYRSAKFSELAAERRTRHEVVVLDVRRPDEWQAGHIDGAVHVPLYELEGRTGELPQGELWVHCESGYRAAIGASLLDRAGRKVVLIDDDWERAAPSGNSVTK